MQSAPETSDLEARVQLSDQISIINRRSMRHRLCARLPALLVALAIFIGPQAVLLVQSSDQASSLNDLPGALSMALMPISQCFAPVMLLGLQPDERYGSLAASMILGLVCAFYMILMPVVLAVYKVDDPVIITRNCVIAVAEAYWGYRFLQHGASSAIAGLWRGDERWDLHPRAALNGMWMAWRYSAFTVAFVDLVATIVVVAKQASDGSLSWAEPQSEPEPEPEPSPSPSPEPEPSPSPEPEPEPEGRRVEAVMENVLGPSWGDTGATPEHWRLLTAEPEPLPEPTVSLDSTGPQLLSSFLANLLLLALTLALTRRTQARLRMLLAKLDQRKQDRGAAVIASFLNSSDPSDSILFARARFRGLRWSDLREEDLVSAREQTGRTPGDRLANHSFPASWGSIDAFVSHAWADDPHQRWCALKQWADGFQKVKPSPPPPSNCSHTLATPSQQRILRQSCPPHLEPFPPYRRI